MPLVTQVVDALWHCLCPAFSKRSIVIPTKARSLVRLAPVGCAGNSSLGTDPTKRPTGTRPYRKLQQPPKRPDESKFLLKKKRTVINDNATAIAPERPSNKSQALRAAGKRGDYVQIHGLIKAIGKEGPQLPNNSLYAALFLANTCAEHGSAEEVRRLLGEMREEGIEPDSQIYHAALKVLAVHPDYILRTQILDEMQEKWFTLNEDGWHHVIVGLLKERQIELALDRLEHMQREEMRIPTWLHDLMVYKLCDLGEIDEAVRIMKHRFNRGEFNISGTLWFYLLDTASRSLHYEATCYVWKKRVDTNYFNPSSGICINILNIAARHGDTQLATSVFRLLGKRSHRLQLHHYEAILESYLNASDLRAAFIILTIMARAGIQPEEATTRPIYLYCRGSPSRAKEALAILHDLKKEKETARNPIPAVAVNCIIEAYIHQRDPNAALATYKVLHTLCPTGPTTATFNALFRPSPNSPPKSLAMFLASEMVALKIPPDTLTYDRLILVCVEDQTRDGYTDAFRYLQEMKSLGWWPRRGTMAAMVKRLVESGDERVFGLLQEMEEMNVEYLGMQRWVGEQWKGTQDGKRAQEMRRHGSKRSL